MPVGQPGVRTPGAVDSNLVVNEPLQYVFQHLTRLGIHTDFVRTLRILDVKRVPEAAAALFSLQFLVGHCAWPRLERYDTRLGQSELRWSDPG